MASPLSNPQNSSELHRKIPEPFLLSVPDITHNCLIRLLKHYHGIYHINRIFQLQSAKERHRNTDKPYTAGIDKQADLRVPAAAKHADDIDEIEHFKRHI